MIDMERAIRATLAAVALSWAGLAWSSSHEFNLTGRVDELLITPIGAPGPGGTTTYGAGLLLADAQTGQTEFGPLRVAVGDTLVGDIRLDRALMAPPGSLLQSFSVNFGDLTEEGVSISYEGVLTVLNLGVPVQPTSDFRMFGGSFSHLAVGGYSNQLPFGGFSFDAVHFEIQVTGIRSAAQVLPAAEVQAGGRALMIQYLAPVPELPVSLMLLAGCVLIAAAPRRRAPPPAAAAG